MGHEIGDSLQHAPGLQDKSREGDTGKVHSHSVLSIDSASQSGEVMNQSDAAVTRLSWEISEEMMLPSSSSLLCQSKTMDGDEQELYIDRREELQTRRMCRRAQCLLVPSRPRWILVA